MKFFGDEFWGLRNRGILTKIVHGLDVLQKDQHPIQPEPLSLRGPLRVSFLKWFLYVPRQVWNPGNGSPTKWFPMVGGSTGTKQTWVISKGSG